MRKSAVLILFMVLSAVLAAGTYSLECLQSGSYEVGSFLRANASRVYYGTRDSLFLWDLQAEGELRRTVSAGRPETFRIDAAALSPNGEVWEATNKGLFRFGKQGWSFHSDIISEHIVVNSDGALWLINYTLMRYDGLEFTPMVSDMEWQTQVFSASLLEIDRQGYPWIGVMGPGVIRFNGVNLDSGMGVPTGPPSDEPGQDDAAPQCLCFDLDNNLWVDHPGGASRWKDGAWQEFYLYELGFRGPAVHLETDTRGLVWACNGGQRVACFDGEKWFEPEISSGPDISDADLQVTDMVAGPDGSMLFALSTVSGDMSGVYILKPVREDQVKAEIEDVQAVKRSYPPPVLDGGQSRDAQGLKGPVKTVSSQNIHIPSYFSYSEFLPDGKLNTSSAGRTSVWGESNHWYDERGNLARSHSIEYMEGGEQDNSQTFYEYEYDAQGYPLSKVTKSAEGEVWQAEHFSYSDTTYVKEWETEANEYAPGFAYRESYDSQGRIVLWTSTNLSDGSIDQRAYGYFLQKNRKVEWTEWNGQDYNRKRVVTLTPRGQEGDWTLYDGAGRILAQNTVTLNAQGDIVSAVYVDKAENTSSRTNTKYTYDRFGNPLSVESTIDGEADEWGSNTFSYEYY